MKYDNDLRLAALRRILPPHQESLSDVSQDTKIPLATLTRWKHKALSDGLSFTEDGRSKNLTSADKFKLVMAADSVKDRDLADFADKNGVTVRQLITWRKICENANEAYELAVKQYEELLFEKDQLIKQLQTELAKKDKALKEGSAIEALREKNNGGFKGPRGRMISSSDRQICLNLIHESMEKGASLQAACRTLGILERTYFRWKKRLETTQSLEDLRPTSERPDPPNKLSPEAEQKVLEYINSPEFAEASPRKIVDTLAERDIYIGSPSTIYRVIRKYNVDRNLKK
ncbi:MAG: helix-turn-helix domain-containing protein [Desulfovibrionaceae bacterium]|nr:helix-turn-helix domain-containing protein [Desulfovibrionaceae bacterium]